MRKRFVVDWGSGNGAKIVEKLDAALDQDPNHRRPIPPEDLPFGVVPIDKSVKNLIASIEAYVKAGIPLDRIFPIQSDFSDPNLIHHELITAIRESGYGTTQCIDGGTFENFRFNGREKIFKVINAIALPYGCDDPEQFDFKNYDPTRHDLFWTREMTQDKATRRAAYENVYFAMWSTLALGFNNLISNLDCPLEDLLYTYTEDELGVVMRFAHKQGIPFDFVTRFHEMDAFAGNFAGLSPKQNKVLDDVSEQSWSFSDKPFATAPAEGLISTIAEKPSEAQNDYEFLKQKRVIVEEIPCPHPNRHIDIRIFRSTLCTPNLAV